MNRREFVILSSAASGGALCLRSQDRAQDRDPRVPVGREPFAEDQHPTSHRGQELARIARSIHIERNIEYVQRPERSLKLSVYRPHTNARKPCPVILNFGLAAWVTDAVDYRLNLDKLPLAPTPNIYPPVLVPQGYAVIGAQLRSSREAPFPAQIQDCQAAFHWVLANAPSRGFDIENIGLLGASASGQLVSLLALMDGAKPLLDPVAKLQWPLPVKAVCSMSGFYDFEYYRQDPGDGTLWPQIRQFLGGSYEERPQVYRNASPQHYIHAGAPPFFMDHGIQDRRVPYSQALRFHAALKKAGVSVEFEPINHYHHGPAPGDIPDPPYMVTDQRIYRFFREHLQRA